jgi:DNA-binding MarR family transcriptional regulator
MQRRSNAPKGIKDLFYETRVLSGREYTVTRFAKEVLGGAVDPVMLGYIEKGKRFPNEALVRRLAAVRNEPVAPLLAVLYRDRMLYAFGRELRRALHDPTEVEGIADADLAVQVSRAIAALPDDGAWITTAKWRTQIGVAVRDKSKSSDVSRVTDLLKERGLVEQAKGKVRRKSRHFVATTLEERRALAMEFTAIYTKALLDKVSLPERAAATHLRNHYLHIERERLPEFYQKLEKAARALAEEFAADAGAGTEFLNVLIVGTPV